MALRRPLLHPRATARTLATLQAAANVRVEPAAATLSAAKTTRLANGAAVASQDSSSPVASIAVVVAAGSRHEAAATVGASHYLRALAFKSTAQRSALHITRSSEAAGTVLNAYSNREYVVYAADLLRDNLDEVMGNVLDCVTAPAFHPWEVKEANEVVAASAGYTYREAIVADLFKGAFRGTLGRPVNCPSHQIGSLTPDVLRSYVAQQYTGNNIAVVGLGVDHEALVALAQPLASLPAQGGLKTPARFYGSEIRTDDGNDTVHFAFGFNGVKAGSDSALATAVVANLLGGTGSNIEWSEGNNATFLARAVAKATSAGVGVQAMSANYSDAGLVGVVGSVDATKAHDGVSATAAAVKDVLAGKFTDADVAAAKNQLRLQVLLDSRHMRLGDMAHQLLATGQFSTPEEIAAKVEGITTDAVRAAAKALSQSKPVFAARGSLEFVPYLDELL